MVDNVSNLALSRSYP